MGLINNNTHQTHKTMRNKIVIAVDAMGGESSPQKIVDGIELSLSESKENLVSFLVFIKMKNI